jgi:DNA-binding transcriptional ArsR family regulator
MKCNIGGDADTHFPSPNHFRSRLGILIRGEALVHGRTVVLSEDLPMARWITQSSMPGRRGPVLLALLDGGRGVDEIATATGLSKDTVRANLKALVGTGVVDEEPCPVGAVGRPPSSYRINADAFARML